MKFRMRTLVTVCLLPSFEALAQDRAGQTFQDCGSGTPRVIIESGPQVAFNDFGPINQTVLGLAGTVGFCTPRSTVRWRFEGNYVHVDETFGKADAVQIGVGFTTRPIANVPELTVTPIARVGYEEFSAGRSNFLYGGSVTFEFVTPIGSADHASGPSLQLVAVERPEYVSRSAVGSPIPVVSGSQDTFSNFASLGLDGSFGRTSKWRWKTVLASTSIAEDAATNQIFSGILSLRPTTGNGASYPWSTELWFSRGNGGYRGLLLSFIVRLD